MTDNRKTVCLICGEPAQAEIQGFGMCNDTEHIELVVKKALAPARELIRKWEDM